MMSGVYQGLKEAPGIYNKRVTFSKIYLTYFATAHNITAVGISFRIKSSKMWYGYHHNLGTYEQNFKFITLH